MSTNPCYQSKFNLWPLIISHSEVILNLKIKLFESVEKEYFILKVRRKLYASYRAKFTIYNRASWYNFHYNTTHSRPYWVPVKIFPSTLIRIGLKKFMRWKEAVFCFRILNIQFCNEKCDCLIRVSFKRIYKWSLLWLGASLHGRIRS